MRVRQSVFHQRRFLSVIVLISVIVLFIFRVALFRRYKEDNLKQSFEFNDRLGHGVRLLRFEKNVAKNAEKVVCALDFAENRR